MDDPNEVLRQATGADDPQEVLNQAMGIRYKGQYDGNIFNRGLEAAQDFGSNAVDELSGWKNKVANDINVIKPVQMENRSNEDIQADADVQNQQLGQLYSDAIANPAGKIAVTPFLPGQIRAAAGILYAPELAKDVGENYQANLDDPAEVLQAATGDGSNLRRYANAVGKTAYQTLVDPIVQPAKNLISNPAQFGQNIVNDPSKLWSDILLPGAIGKGGYDVSKKAVDGVKSQYGDAMNTLDDMNQSISKAPDAVMMDDPAEVLRQAQGNVPQDTAPTPQTAPEIKTDISMPDKTYYNVTNEVSNAGITDLTAQKLNLLARDFENQFGEPLNVTSMKRDGDGSSWHDSGQAVDLAGGILENNPEARNWIMAQGEKYGLTGLDEYAHPSANATGGHIHFSDHGEALSGESIPKQNANSTLENNGSYTEPKTINSIDDTSFDVQKAPVDEGDVDIFGKPLNQPDDLNVTKDQQIQADIDKLLNGEPIDSSNPVKNDVSAADLLNGENKKYSFDFSGDPSQINNRDWYHGSGTADLSPDNLTTNSTNIEGLFGHGVYLTDNVDIAKGYASARSRRTKTPTVYRANVNVDNVLNLERQMPDQAYDVFHNAAESIANRYDYPEILSDIEKAKNENGESVYTALSSGISDISQDLQIPKSEFVEDFQDLSVNLKNAGYDAYTHVGGKRTGNDSHQVLIMLDPSDELSLTGRTRQITKFSPYDVNKEHSGIEFSRVPTKKSLLLKSII